MTKHKKIRLFTAALLIFAFAFSFSFALAESNTGEDSSTASSVVNSITLSGDGSRIEWEVDGYSTKGFKVVWSQNENPVYPNRDGDKYHYYSDPNKVTDDLTAFSGSGTYYVRVCEYLGGACGVYSNEISVQLTDSSSDSDGSDSVISPDFNPGDISVMIESDGSENNENNNASDEVSISLTSSGSNVSWSINGNSAKGFKVVWSKNSGATYPTRSGDKYHYYSSPNKNSDKLTAFDGDGVYYARVCEYLGGKCGVYSNEVEVNLAGNATTVVKKVGKGNVEKSKDIIEIENKAKEIANDNFDSILDELKELRNVVKEQQAQIKYLIKLKDEVQALTSKLENAINDFITYGVDENTQKLGAGERAAVMYSYKSAFGKLPEDEDELADAIKIANGRWPSMTNEEAENKAKEKFKFIYKRSPNMENSKDSAAVTVMAYGLRQKAENRNLNSEKKGIEIFKNIYNKLPETTDEWNAMQAITYSGATRDN
ncbi:MAG: hypothetical protein ABIA02_02470 [Candidatus Falkowbacteria bacterium]